MGQVAQEVAALCGRRPKAARGIPRAVVTVGGLVVPWLRELKESRHQFERPFVLDATLTERTFGITATPWEVTLKETVDYLSGTAA
jgi:hypothetical protein